jgi:hypothetical protein
VKIKEKMQRNKKEEFPIRFCKKSEKVTVTSHEGRLSLETKAEAKEEVSNPKVAKEDDELCTASRLYKIRIRYSIFLSLQSFDHDQIQTCYQDTDKTYSKYGLKRKKGDFTIFASLEFP